MKNSTPLYEHQPRQWNPFAGPSIDECPESTLRYTLIYRRKHGNLSNLPWQFVVRNLHTALHLYKIQDSVAQTATQTVEISARSRNYFNAVISVQDYADEV